MAINSRIGGQAVMEGIMMRNNDKYAIAVRKPDEKIEVKVEDVKYGELEKKCMKIPIIRGVFSFVSSLVTGISCLMFSATFFEEEDEDVSKLTKEELKVKNEKKEKEDKIFMTVTLIIAIALSIGIFMALPYFCMILLEKVVSENWILSLFESIIRIVIFFIYIVLISKMKDIQRTFMYHGAEHKCINCVEHGMPLNVDNVLKSSRLHKRCGTSFLFFVVIVSAVFLMLIQAESHTMRILIRVLLIPVIAGVSYEIIRLAGSSDSKFMTALSKPGLAFQKFTTKEPDASMAEVAIAAVEAVFDWRAFLKENFNLDVPAKTRREAYVEAIHELQDAGVEEYIPVAKKLMLCANDITFKEYIAGSSKIMTDTAYNSLKEMVKRRINGEPVQYITGKADFYGYEFKSTPSVLIPRFDTENLVKAALELTNEGDEVLDLCTGSGCIIISMSKEKNIKATGSDFSSDALDIAKENAQSFDADVKWILSDMFDKIDDKYDVIVSNPPYIKHDVIKTLEPQVRDHEPLMALDGGEDGLNFYRIIAKNAGAYLKERGRLCLEIGYDQADKVSCLLSENGFESVTVLKDLSGLDRVVTCIKTGA